MTGQTLYLSSLDSARFEPVRECRIQRLLTFDTGKVAAVATLSPGVVGQDFNRASDIGTVVLSPRHEEVSIDPVSAFPCFVFITIPREGYEALLSQVLSDDLEIIGWGELYRTRDDAERHAFG
jgi:hypothetical protein